MNEEMDGHGRIRMLQGKDHGEARKIKKKWPNTPSGVSTLFLWCHHEIQTCSPSLPVSLGTLRGQRLCCPMLHRHNRELRLLLDPNRQVVHCRVCQRTKDRWTDGSEETSKQTSGE